MEKKNISPEIEAAIEEGRRQGLREAAEYVAGLKEVRVPYVVRGLSSAFVDGEEDADGWAKMSSGLKAHLMRVSAGIERLVNHEPVPECPHVWTEGADAFCAACGKSRTDLAA